jgi:RNA polymerase sigma factor (sigma-70 family)
VDTLSPNSLAEAIRRGDPDAESQLFARFGRRVYVVALHALRSPFAADDVRSETMLRVTKALREGRLREPDALPGFVLQTARNVIREQRRQGRRTVSLDDPESSVLEPVAHDVPEAIEPAVVEAVRRATHTLGERDRLFLRFHYYDELPRDEIARRLGISEDRVRLIKSRALQRFREAYRAMVPGGAGGIDTN